MGAPTPSSPPSPAGIHLRDGYQSFVTIAALTTASVWLKTVTPPGIDGGPAVDQTTMHNANYITRDFQSLIDLKESTFTAAYDPDIYNQIFGYVNTNTTITFHYPDGSTLAFFGGIRMFDFAPLVRGQQPECTVTFTPTNLDPSDNTEAAPVLTSVAGT